MPGSCGLLRLIICVDQRIDGGAGENKAAGQIADDSYMVGLCRIRSNYYEDTDDTA